MQFYDQLRHLVRRKSKKLWKERLRLRISLSSIFLSTDRSSLKRHLLYNETALSELFFLYFLIKSKTYLYVHEVMKIEFREPVSDAEGRERSLAAELARYRRPLNTVAAVSFVLIVFRDYILSINTQTHNTFTSMFIHLKLLLMLCTYRVVF